MVDWQVTAVTLYCDAVDDEVTVIIAKDWSAKCSGYKKYHEPTKETARQLEKKSKQAKRPLKCVGLECRPVLEYKKKLSAEEAGKAAKGG